MINYFSQIIIKNIFCYNHIKMNKKKKKKKDNANKDNLVFLY